MADLGGVESDRAAVICVTNHFYIAAIFFVGRSGSGHRRSHGLPWFCLALNGLV
jgi:hypothetical protein